MTRSVDQVPDVALDGFTTSRDGLTAAEVKQRIAAGQVNVVRDHTSRSVGEIAEQLVLSSNTVSTYRARILEKTGVRNDVELALYAVREGL